MMNAERLRLEETARRQSHWRRWGPYLSERQWGTVREDYSADGAAWDYFPFEHSHLRTYRWGEDGLLGISDNHQRLCFALALWNGRDAILKERLFGLSGTRGSHGEDVKELYYYLDSTPTHSYMKALYKYPQRAFPYAELMAGGRRPKSAFEFELMDTGVFDDDRYFDVFAEYAKASTDDILIRLTVVNRGPEAAPLHVLPTLWYRNRWSWGGTEPRPVLAATDDGAVEVIDETLGRYEWWADNPDEWLFTENETNAAALWGGDGNGSFTKDGIGRRVILGDRAAVRGVPHGTKASAWYALTLGAGETRVIRLRLRRQGTASDPASGFEGVFASRQREADAFYQDVQAGHLGEDGRNVQRQAFAGLLWTKQFYHYVVERWLDGDPSGPPPPASRLVGRNVQWRHLFNADVLSMPDKWEYPWFAAWDTAFHMIPFSMIDPGFAKHQLGLFLREWYMHPNGQVPAYEWALDDVNPPVHAWACWRVYKIDQKMNNGRGDRLFLESVFHKLLMNFTWWVNRKDSIGNNIFEGGFLGLDNIGVFDRSKPLPTGGIIEQSDGTSWMAMYCLDMLRIAMELALTNPAYEDVASKFLEHFLYIANAMNKGGGAGLWDEEEGFYYDRIHLSAGNELPVKIRSMVGLIPLFAADTLEPRVVARLAGFKRRMDWFIDNRPDLCGNLASMTRPGQGERRLLSLVGRERLRRVLGHMLDESQFLSPYGIRSLSRYHERTPYTLRCEGETYRVDYEPAESRTGMFGGNSNWRGPIWFPVNFLIIEALQKLHHYHGDLLQVEFPTGSGKLMNLGQVASALSQRLARIFLRNEQGRRPVYGGVEKLQTDPHFKDLVLFFEYFNGNDGAGLGANHQTGWTALVAKLLQQSGE